MSKRLRQVISTIFLFVFCFYITPKEVLHLFSHHEDSEHSILNKGVHFEKKHHHCSLLNIDQDFSSISFEIPFYDFSKSALFFITFQKSIRNDFISSFIVSIKQLRAPPFSVV